MHRGGATDLVQPAAGFLPVGRMQTKTETVRQNVQSRGKKF